jgi:hypothetical protein
MQTRSKRQRNKARDDDEEPQPQPQPQQQDLQSSTSIKKQKRSASTRVQEKSRRCFFQELPCEIVTVIMTFVDKGTAFEQLWRVSQHFCAHLERSVETGRVTLVHFFGKHMDPYGNSLLERYCPCFPNIKNLTVEGGQGRQGAIPRLMLQTSKIPPRLKSLSFKDCYQISGLIVGKDDQERNVYLPDSLEMLNMTETSCSLSYVMFCGKSLVNFPLLTYNGASLCNMADGHVVDLVKGHWPLFHDADAGADVQWQKRYPTPCVALVKYAIAANIQKYERLGSALTLACAMLGLDHITTVQSLTEACYDDIVSDAAILDRIRVRLGKSTWQTLLGSLNQVFVASKDKYVHGQSYLKFLSIVLKACLSERDGMKHSLSTVALMTQFAKNVNTWWIHGAPKLSLYCHVHDSILDDMLDLFEIYRATMCRKLDRCRKRYLARVDADTDAGADKKKSPVYILDGTPKWRAEMEKIGAFLCETLQLFKFFSTGRYCRDVAEMEATTRLTYSFLGKEYAWKKMFPYLSRVSELVHYIVMYTSELETVSGNSLDLLLDKVMHSIFCTFFSTFVQGSRGDNILLARGRSGVHGGDDDDDDDDDDDYEEEERSADDEARLAKHFYSVWSSFSVGGILCAFLGIGYASLRCQFNEDYVYESVKKHCLACFHPCDILDACAYMLRGFTVNVPKDTWELYCTRLFALVDTKDIPPLPILPNLSTVLPPPSSSSLPSAWGLDMAFDGVSMSSHGLVCHDLVHRKFVDRTRELHRDHSLYPFVVTLSQPPPPLLSHPSTRNVLALVSCDANEHPGDTNDVFIACQTLVPPQKVAWWRNVKAVHGTGAIVSLLRLQAGNVWQCYRDRLSATLLPVAAASITVADAIRVKMRNVFVDTLNRLQQRLGCIEGCMDMLRRTIKSPKAIEFLMNSSGFVSCIVDLFESGLAVEWFLDLVKKARNELDMNVGFMFSMQCVAEMVRKTFCVLYECVSASPELCASVTTTLNSHGFLGLLFRVVTNLSNWFEKGCDRNCMDKWTLVYGKAFDLVGVMLANSSEDVIQHSLTDFLMLLTVIPAKAMDEKIRVTTFICSALRDMFTRFPRLAVAFCHRRFGGLGDIFDMLRAAGSIGLVWDLLSLYSYLYKHRGLADLAAGGSEEEKASVERWHGCMVAEFFAHLHVLFHGFDDGGAVCHQDPFFSDLPYLGGQAADSGVDYRTTLYHNFLQTLDTVSYYSPRFTAETLKAARLRACGAFLDVMHGGEISLVEAMIISFPVSRLRLVSEMFAYSAHDTQCRFAFSSLIIRLRDLHISKFDDVFHISFPSFMTTVTCFSTSASTSSSSSISSSSSPLSLLPPLMPFPIRTFSASASASASDLTLPPLNLSHLSLMAVTNSNNAAIANSNTAIANSNNNNNNNRPEASGPVLGQENQLEQQQQQQEPREEIRQQLE